jgi:hypothetical protein
MAHAIPPQPPSWLDEIRAILTELAAHEKQLTKRHEALAEAVELFHHAPVVPIGSLREGQKPYPQPRG